ncbi:MAG: hypothetical protein MUP53_06745, partial [Bacteroidales bacterium]|nr:hypothetical protein [Bacteroidales bacterium]
MEKHLDRRHFIKTGSIITAGITFAPYVLKAGGTRAGSNPVRLGAPVPGNFADPAEWVKSVKALRYS